MARKRGVVCLRGGYTPMPTMIILSHLELLRKFNPKLNSSILMEILIVNVVFLHLYPIKAGNISKEDGGI